MSGEVLEPGQHPGVTQTPGVRAGVLGDQGRIGTEGPVADHRVVGCAGNVDDRCEANGGAEIAHLVQPGRYSM